MKAQQRIGGLSINGFGNPYGEVWSEDIVAKWGEN